METSTFSKPARADPDDYRFPIPDDRCAGIVLTLSGHEHPDTTSYDDPEVVWRLARPYHAGRVVASDDSSRVDALLSTYADRFARDFV